MVVAAIAGTRAVANLKSLAAAAALCQLSWFVAYRNDFAAQSKSFGLLSSKDAGLPQKKNTKRSRGRIEERTPCTRRYAELYLLNRFVPCWTYCRSSETVIQLLFIP